MAREKEGETGREIKRRRIHVAYEEEDTCGI
jgi:hypothetical protein